jgi:hypothetical protein
MTSVSLLPKNRVFSSEVPEEAAIKTDINKDKIERGIKKPHFQVFGRKIPSCQCRRIKKDLASHQ